MLENLEITSWGPTDRPPESVLVVDGQTGRATGTIVTVTGKVVAPLALQPEKVDLEDIAHGLSNICRFTGGTRVFYSVAQHSVLISWALGSTEFALEGLLHDAAEAYLGDIVRPLKGLPEFAFYREAIARAEKIIADKFGFPAEMSEAVAEMDMRALATEYRDLMLPAKNDDGTDRWAYLDGIIPFPDTIVPWTPQKAKRLFLLQYQNLVPAAERARIAQA